MQDALPAGDWHMFQYKRRPGALWGDALAAGMLSWRPRVAGRRRMRRRRGGGLVTRGAADVAMGSWTRHEPVRRA